MPINNILQKITGPDGNSPINLTGSLLMDDTGSGPLTIVGQPIAPGKIQFLIPDNRVGNGGNITLQCDGSKPTVIRGETNTVEGAQFIIDFPIQLQPSFPPRPTRSQVCSLQLIFQGLPITIP